MSTVMMKCGCASQGTRTATKGVPHDPIPACLIHDCVDIATDEPDMTGRTARCAYYGGATSRRGSYGGGNECNYGQSNAQRCTCEQPSAKNLPFFEYLGPGSRESATKCKCGYYESAHRPGTSIKCRKFEPCGASEFDKFYCGCQGWD